ncbi:hypothetical protein M422DRAFT_27114 [Sphaerobolus stellatus SS14]|nr:hypothetical protein M422DRAFT_27114 [Sphaerobolus stellatus SS14]
MASTLFNRNADPQRLLETSYRAANSAVQLSYRQVRFDRLEERAMPPIPSSLRPGSNSNGDSNNGNQGASQINSITQSNFFKQSVQAASDVFAEHAKTLIKGLEEIQKIHPVIAAAVVAFKLIINLDIKRRENNKKVLLIKYQMQNMMKVLLRLKDVKDPEQKDPDGKLLSDSLGDLMKDIEEDIIRCGAACDNYLNKSFIRKLISSSKYEKLLAEFVTKFAERKSELDHLLVVHITLGINAANTKLDDLLKATEEMKKATETARLNTDNVLKYLQELDTDKEKNLRSYINWHGGPEACIANNETLRTLISEAGDKSLGVGRNSQKLQELSADELAKARKTLSQELSEDIELIMERHLEYFNTKLDIQRQQIDESIQAQGSRIINVFQSGAYEQIENLELRTIWKEMGWKGNVKARTLVFALRDYFLHRPSSSDSNGKASVVMNSDDPESLEWAKDYIGITHLQPIIEAIDDDASGWVNVNEVNSFVTDRPEYWTLLQRLSYWAVGWHLNISDYKAKIYGFLKDIYTIIPLVRPVNRGILHDYFDLPAIYRLEALLGCTTPFPKNIRVTPELEKLRDTFAVEEEFRMHHALERLSYVIDSTPTINLITGPGRIEKHLYTLLYLLIKHQRDVLYKARTEYLDENIIYQWNSSLNMIFSLIFERTAVLEAMFKHMHLDAGTKLKHYAFGMFSEFRAGNVLKYNVNKFLQVWDDMGGRTGLLIEEFDFKPVVSDCKTDDYMLELPPAVMRRLWFGHCFMEIEENRSKYGFMELNITQLCNFFEASGTLKIEGDTHELSGIAIEELRYGYSVYEIDIVVTLREGIDWLRLTGHLNPETGFFTGNWCNYGTRFDDTKPTPGDGTSKNSLGPFSFSRNPVDFRQFYYNEQDFAANPALSRWKYACAAVLSNTRFRLNSWSYIKEWVTERRSFTALWSCEILDDWFSRFNVSDTPLPADAKATLSALRKRIPVSYQEIYSDLFLPTPRYSDSICDHCGQDIIQLRFTCITCVLEDHGNQVDLCLSCINQDGLRGRADDTNLFMHELSHSLLCTEYELHKFELAWLRPRAELMSKLIKSSLTVVREFSLASYEEILKSPTKLSYENKAVLNSLRCTSCNATVSPPFWVCIVCDPFNFTCNECFTETFINRLGSPFQPTRVTPHEGRIFPRHVWMRIFDSAPVQSFHQDTNDMERLENKMVKLNSRLDTLEDKLNGVVQRLTTIDTVSERLSSMESLLQQLTLMALNGNEDRSPPPEPPVPPEPQTYTLYESPIAEHMPSPPVPPPPPEVYAFHESTTSEPPPRSPELYDFYESPGEAPDLD